MTIKMYIRIFVLVLLLGLGFSSYYLYNQNKAQEAEITNLNIKDKVKDGEIKRYENKLGMEIAVVNGYKSTIINLEKSLDSTEQLLHKVIKASDLKDKQIKDGLVIINNIQASGTSDDYTFQDTIENNDSNCWCSGTFIINDGYLDITISEEDYFYSMNDTIVALQAWTEVDRNFFLWRWIKWKKMTNNVMVEVSSTNPNSTLKSRLIEINKNDTK